MLIRPRGIDFFVTDCTTRLPFRFGMATMTWAPLIGARVEVELQNGRVARGFSADLMVPKWFEKDPAKSIADDVATLTGSVREAAAALLGDAAPATAFEHWWRTYRERTGGLDADPGRGLAAGFGVALIERALIDACCRAQEASFHTLLHGDALGFAPGSILPELAGWSANEQLPKAPPTHIHVRHTVGLADALRASDLGPGERIDDGLPESLEEDLATFGLRHLKVKVGGDPQEDVRRLRTIAEVVAAYGGGGAALPLTLDGNEQYADPDLLVVVLDELAAESQGKELLDGLLYIEQPLPRAISFEAAVEPALRRLAARAPLLIDEADYGVAAFPRALEVGYQGVSVKNCKGVFRALLNRALCDAGDGERFQSAEDLTNLPVVALQQDLATVQALGLPHVERNGHHYFHGLRHLSTAERERAVTAHPELYRRGGDDIYVRIEDGQLDVSSIANAPGYGTAIEPDLGAGTSLADWTPPHHLT